MNYQEYKELKFVLNTAVKVFFMTLAIATIIILIFKK
jgi:hypothetical protein